MLVNAGAHEESPAVVAPFVLGISTVYVHPLRYIVVITHGHVVEVVVVVLKSCHKFRRHEPQALEP